MARKHLGLCRWMDTLGELSHPWLVTCNNPVGQGPWGSELRYLHRACRQVLIVPPCGSLDCVVLMRAAGGFLFYVSVPVSVSVDELPGLAWYSVTSCSPRGAEECEHVMIDTRPRKDLHLKNPDLVCPEVASTSETY